MKFIDALNLLNKCVEVGILHKQDKCIAVYRSQGATQPEGWYLTPVHDLAQQLMHDHTGIALLQNELKAQGHDL